MPSLTAGTGTYVVPGEPAVGGEANVVCKRPGAPVLPSQPLALNIMNGLRGESF
jgi:hypothetical protein